VLGKSVKHGKLEVQVSDVVSPKEALLVRWALDDGALSEWTAAEALSAIEVGDASELTIEAKDEEGNVATSRQALIRGEQDASLIGDSACSCSVPGNDRTSGAWGLLLLAALGAALSARRRGSAPR